MIRQFGRPRLVNRTVHDAILTDVQPGSSMKVKSRNTPEIDAELAKRVEAAKNKDALEMEKERLIYGGYNRLLSNHGTSKYHGMPELDAALKNSLH